MKKIIEWLAAILLFGGAIVMVVCMVTLMAIQFIDSPADAAWAGVMCGLIAMGTGFLMLYHSKE